MKFELGEEVKLPNGEIGKIYRRDKRQGENLYWVDIGNGITAPRVGENSLKR